MRYRFLWYLILCLQVLFLSVGCRSETNSNISLYRTQSSKAKSTESKKILIEENSEIPDYAIEVLSYIRTNNKAPKGYKGGRKFFNREKLLPVKDHRNQTIQYKEWDVHPFIKGKNRGPERLVTSAQTAWFTSNHYQSFTEIIEKQ